MLSPKKVQKYSDKKTSDDVSAVSPSACSHMSDFYQDRLEVFEKVGLGNKKLNKGKEEMDMLAYEQLKSPVYFQFQKTHRRPNQLFLHKGMSTMQQKNAKLRYKL